QAVGLGDVRLRELLFLDPAPVALVAALAIIPLRVRNALVRGTGVRALVLGAAGRAGRGAAGVAVTRDLLLLPAVALVPALGVLRRLLLLLAVFLRLLLALGSRLGLLLLIVVLLRVREPRGVGTAARQVRGMETFQVGDGRQLGVLVD